MVLEFTVLKQLTVFSASTENKKLVSCSFVLIFLSCLGCYVPTLLMKYLLGDLNVHFETVDRPSRDLADLFAEYGLSQQVMDPTRISNHTLDLVFCNL